MFCYLKLTYRKTDNDGEGPHAGIWQGRVETVAAEILAQNCFHVNWQLSQKKVEYPVVAPVSDLELILPNNFLHCDYFKKASPFFI